MGLIEVLRLVCCALAGYIVGYALYQLAWAIRQCWAYYKAYRLCIDFFGIDPLWGEFWRTIRVIGWVEIRSGFGSDRAYVVGVYGNKNELVATFYPAVSWAGRPILDHP